MERFGVHPILSNPLKGLFISSVFEKIGVHSRKIPNRSFTKPGSERIIPKFPYKSPFI
jgi:hypothetical protein